MYENIITAARETVWLSTLSQLRETWTFLDRVSAGLKLDGESMKMMAASNRDRQKVINRSAVGVLPIMGTIAQHASLLDDVSGGVSTDSLSAGFDQLQADEEVGTIVFRIHSGGGTYPGIPEFAEKVFNARGGKPIIAHIDSEAGSGALWIASAADERVITRSGSAGSVGAYKTHEETSQLDETVGVKRTFIVDDGAEYKVEGNDSEPLSEEALAFHKADVNRVGDEFRATVAKYTGTPLKTVKEQWGRGRMLDAKTAKEVGMVDRIATFDETVAKYATGRAKPSKRSRVENAKRYLSIG